MIKCTRLASLVLGSAACVAALILPLGAGVARAAVSPAMTGYVDDEDNFIGLSFADGTSVGAQVMPGPVIPPGTYQVSINDVSQVSDFNLAGQGVSFATGIEARVQPTWTVTFQACALYSYRNDAQNYSVYWFQTSASAASTTACPGPLAGAPTTGATTTTTPTAKIGTKGPTLPPGATLSAIGTIIYTDPLRGTLHGKLAVTGDLALTFDGKPVARLKAGRYKIAATGLTAKGSIVFRKSTGHLLTVSGAAFVGSHTVTIDLSKGRWTFYSSAAKAGSTHPTVVVS